MCCAIATTQWPSYAARRATDCALDRSRQPVATSREVTTTEPVITSPKGVVMQRYALVDGTPGVGDMSAGDQEGWGH
jgi:hypothetical protein